MARETIKKEIVLTSRAPRILIEQLVDGELPEVLKAGRRRKALERVRALLKANDAKKEP